MKIIKLTYLGIFLLVLSSCERTENIDAEIPFKSKLIVASIINADDSVIRVSVSRTTPYIGAVPRSEFPAMMDARVLISGSAGSINLIFDASEQLYLGTASPSTIKSGETYKIEVWQNNEYVTGSTVIPDSSTSVSSMLYDSLLSSGYTTYRARFRCTNTGAHLSNIYLYPFMVYSDSTRYPMMFQQADRIRKLAPCEMMEQEYYGIFASEFVYPVRIELMTYVYDPVYTRYLNQVMNMSMSGASGNPFAEPYIQYSNMSNGIGVFGSYRLINRESFATE